MDKGQDEPGCGDELDLESSKGQVDLGTKRDSPGGCDSWKDEAMCSDEKVEKRTGPPESKVVVVKARTTLVTVAPPCRIQPNRVLLSMQGGPLRKSVRPGHH